MAARVKMAGSAFTANYRRQAGADRSSAYLAWIRSLPCAISGRRPVEAAHLSTASMFYGHAGRGLGRKAGDRWALPLAADLHRQQHAGSEREFWRAAGIDPHLLGLVLRALWDQGASAAYAAEVMELHRPHVAAENRALAATLRDLSANLEQPGGTK